MTLEEFDKLQLIADNEVSLPNTFDGIMEKNRLLPTLLQKWTKLLSGQKYIYSTLNIELLEMQGELMKCYKFPKQTKDLQSKYNITINELWSTGKEIESVINTIPCYIAKAKEVNQQKYILDFIDKTVENIRSMGFIIKDYIKMKELLMATC